jgi:hypothetical protein
MGKHNAEKPQGQSLIGKITRRILSGDIPRDAVRPTTRQETPPKPSSIRGAHGRSLGKGATRGRNGGAGGANDG